MKITPCIALLSLMPAMAAADMTLQEFLEAKTEVRESMATVSCEELREGLPEMAGNVDSLEVQPQNSYEFKLATYGLKVALERAATCVNGSSLSIDWTPAAEYQRLSQQNVDSGLFPYNISGRCQDGILEYRSDWMAVPENVHFDFHYGYSPDKHAERKAALEADGFLPNFSGTFVDCSHNFRMQGLWLK